MKTPWDDHDGATYTYGTMEEYLEKADDREEMVAFVNALRTHWKGQDKDKKIVDLTAMEILALTKKEWVATRKSRHEYQEANRFLNQRVQEFLKKSYRHDIGEACISALQAGLFVGVICACVYAVYVSFHLSYYKIDAIKELGHAGIGGLKEVVETIWGQ